MKYSVKLHEGFTINDANIYIPIGIKKEKLYVLLDSKPQFTMETLDYFDDFRVDFNSNDEAIAFEFFPSAEVFLEQDVPSKLYQKNLFKIPFSELNEILLEIDSHAKSSDAGVISLAYGIGTYQEDSEEDFCETIIFFQEGYYSRLGW